MAKDLFGNTIKPMKFGGFGIPQQKENKRQPVGRSQKNSVKINQKGRCKDCRKILVVEEYHHVKHVANKGKSTTGNLVALCPECHRKRHIKEGALKLDKKRLKKKSGGNCYINPLTGKKEKSNNLWKF